jgi:DDE domain
VTTSSAASSVGPIDQAAAEQARFAGPPTIRVDSHDVEPDSQPADEYTVACRLYVRVGWAVALRLPRDRPVRAGLDVFVSARRDAKAARRFFQRAIDTTKVWPAEVITDQAPVYPIVLEWLAVEEPANRRVAVAVDELALVI